MAAPVAAVGIIQLIATALKYLPELVELIKGLAQGVTDLEQEIRIKTRLREISKAFAESNRAEAARRLNDAFKN